MGLIDHYNQVVMTDGVNQLDFLMQPPSGVATEEAPIAPELIQKSVIEMSWSEFRISQVKEFVLFVIQRISEFAQYRCFTSPAFASQDCEQVVFRDVLEA
jgi:hypothetical protein